MAHEPSMAGAKKEKDTGRERSSICQFTPQMPATARDGPGGSQELGIQLPHWWQGRKFLHEPSPNHLPRIPLLRSSAETHTQALGYGIQEMFHKAEEFFPKTMDSEMDDMDTSDTQWGWFYLAECGKWHMFQPDTNIQCSVSSEDIEKSFKTNPCGSISFTTSKFSYKIDFAEMKQMNLTTGKQRLIKRAPFSISAFSYICENEAIPMPTHWENVNTEVPYQLISLHNQTHEYNEVANLFGKTMDRNRIKRIQRIQNLDLWEFFCRKKAQLKKRRGVPQINEQMLFHGTSSEFVEAICIHNFDWRINGIHGALFGKGRFAPLSSSH
nr:protein mono-ADP-ribosyltransferase PARP11 isoform X6 [Oryctolagus cuniculus]